MNGDELASIKEDAEREATTLALAHFNGKCERDKELAAKDREIAKWQETAEHWMTKAHEVQADKDREIAALRACLRGAWVIEDKNFGTCVVITDGDGIPFRVAISKITAPYWQAWEAQLLAALEMRGVVS